MNRMLEGCVSSVVMLRLGKSLREGGWWELSSTQGLSGSQGCGGAVVDLITVIRAVGPMVDLVVMTRWPLVGAISTALGLVSGGS